MPRRKQPWAVITTGETIVGIDVGDWRAQATVTAQDGSPVISELRLSPLGALPTGGMPARLLRDIPLGQLLDQGRHALGQVREDVLAGQGFTSLDEPGTRRPGRAGHGVDHYLEVALVYTSAPSRGRTQAVADRFGVSKETATQKIHDTRRTYGLLTDSPRPGVAGGDLTEKAKRLLTERGR